MRRRSTAAFSLCLALIVAALLAFGPACSTTAPAPATKAPQASSSSSEAKPAQAPPSSADAKPTQAPAPSTQAQTQKPVELSFATVMPPQAAITQLMELWTKKVMEGSGGKVKINFYPGGSLVKIEEMYRAVPAGIADIVWYAIEGDTGALEMNSFTELPFIGFKSPPQATKIYNEVLHSKTKFPQLWNEWEGAGLIPYGARMPAAFQFFNKTKPVRAPSDLKGMKVYMTGKLSDVVTAAGGAPVSMAIPDVYMALDRGLIEGVFTHYPAMKVFKLLEFQKHATIFGEGGCYAPMNLIMISAKKWNSLPPDVQKAFTDLEQWWLDEGDQVEANELQDALKTAKDLGITTAELTADEIKAWQALAKPLHDDWIKRMEAKGKPGKALWDEVQRLITTYPK